MGFNIGDKIGKLTIIKETNERKYNGYIVFICKCDCGIEVSKDTSYLNNIKSSLQCNNCSKKDHRDKTIKNHLRKGNERLYRIAYGARARCENEKGTSYKYYGGRGIEFNFDSLKHFMEWSLENGYKDDLTIERKEVNGNYCPENCCWIPSCEQSKNRTFTPSFNGKKGYKEIGESMGITKKAIEALVYKKKMTLEEIYQASINDPTFHMSLYEKTSIKAMNRKHEWKLNKKDIEDVIMRIKNGETRTGLSKIYNVDFNTIVKSIKRYEDGYYN